MADTVQLLTRLRDDMQLLLDGYGLTIELTVQDRVILGNEFGAPDREDWVPMEREVRYKLLFRQEPPIPFGRREGDDPVVYQIRITPKHEAQDDLASNEDAQTTEEADDAST